MSNADYITKEGLEKLKEKLNRLNLIERPAVVKQVVTAREMGDLSENAEYHAARERQRHIDNEISYIRSRINKLKVIDPAVMPKDAARFGAVVKVNDMDNEGTLIYQLVGADEASEPYTNEITGEQINPVSIVSPIGKSLLGKKKGEIATAIVPIGERKFKVIDIK